MEIELLGARGIPQTAHVSVSAAGERKQAQLSTLDRPLRFRMKAEDASQIKIDVLDVLGRARLPFQSAEQQRTLNLDPVTGASTPNRPVNMEVDIVVRPIDSDNPSSPVKEDVRQRREANANSYLEDHGLTNFIQFLLHSLMEDKPSDPYPFLQKQIAMRMQSKAGGGAMPSSNAPAYSTNPLFTLPTMQDDAEVTTLLGNLSPTAAQRGTADIATLEREAEEARQRLLADNELLKKSAGDLSAEYERLMMESAQLQKQLDAKRQGKAVEAYREIEKLQDEVKMLARENAALVSKLARGREMINLVRQDMQQIQQDIGK